MTARAGDAPRRDAKRFRVVRGVRGWTVVDDTTGRELATSRHGRHPLMQTEAEILCGCLNSSPDAKAMVGHSDLQIVPFPSRAIASATQEDD